VCVRPRICVVVVFVFVFVLVCVYVCVFFSFFRALSSFVVLCFSSGACG